MRVVALQAKVVENLANYCKEYYDWVDVILNEIEAECDKANSQPHRKLRGSIRKAREEIQEAATKESNNRAKKEKRKKLED